MSSKHFSEMTDGEIRAMCGARTPEQIYEEIAAAREAHTAREYEDSPRYWTANAEDQDEIRDLWRELVAAVELDTGGTPTWAVTAAGHAGQYAEQLARQYRRFARDVTER